MRRSDPFPRTLWTMVIDAAEGVAHPDFEANWRRLVDLYRQPIAASVRRMLRWFPELAVEDTVSELFSYVYERGVLSKADPAKGQFRQFIQGVSRNFVLAKADKVRRERADPAALGADLETVAPDASGALAEEEERGWMHGLVADALHRCHAKHPQWALVFARRHGLALPGEDDTEPVPLSPEQVAQQLGKSVGAIHVARHRAQAFIRDAVRKRIGDACAGWEDYEREVRLIELRADEHSRGMIDDAMAG